jgi:hypothetical protein
LNDREVKETKEKESLGFEIFKHLTTLNAGSIVLIGTFLGDIFPKDPQGNLSVGWLTAWVIAFSFVWFGLSLVASTFCMYQFARFETSLSIWFKSNTTRKNVLEAFLTLLRPVAGISFFLGIIFFGFAVLKNLL